MKNYTYDEQNSLNSLIINPRVAAWPHCSSFDIFWYPDQFIDFLLAESAMRIYIPDRHKLSLPIMAFIKAHLNTSSTIFIL